MAPSKFRKGKHGKIAIKPKASVSKSRKQIRKELRKQKKANKALYYQSKGHNVAEPAKKVSKLPSNVIQTVNISKKREEDKLRNLEKQKASEAKSVKEKEQKRIAQLRNANLKENNEIMKLEKKLKLNKRKSKSTPKSFVNDGLDYILDFCDEEDRRQMLETEKQILDADIGREFEEDFNMIMGMCKTEDNKLGEEIKQTNNLEVGKFEKMQKPKQNSLLKFDTPEEGCSYEDDTFDTDSDNFTENSELSENSEKYTFSEDETLYEISTKQKTKLCCRKNEVDTMKRIHLNKVSEAGKYVKLKKVKRGSDSDESEVVKDRLANLKDDCNKKHKTKDQSTTSSDLIGWKAHTSKESGKLKNFVGKKEVLDSDEYNIIEESEGSESSNKTKNNNEDNEFNGKYWEDIYGRKRDTDGNIVQNKSKYIPPAARVDHSQSENLRLQRQLKGLINRLAEHNMHTISGQIEDLYMSNSRNSMNENLSSLMLEALAAPILTPDRMIAEHMMLVAILHANVGIEVGAHFLLTVVRRIDQGLDQEQIIENKEIDNMILMLAYLYNFRIFGHKLLYQILDRLADKFTEKEIELILLALKNVGFLLRKDDPVALKNLILRLQQKASSISFNNARVKFMLDIVLAIKNNNMSKIPSYDPSHVEHLKKIMRNYLHKGNSVTQFNISLEDLLHANERGKWWVVGSAWSGTEIDKKQEPSSNKRMMFSQQMLELARKQRMNTDVRKNIFCIIMSAEDYLDAFEKLHRLSLKDQQERELIYVLMDCCLQEKNFNPYYAILAQKFCEHDRKFQLTIQYTLWDKLKTLDHFNDQQLSNLARFLTFLFLEKSIAFSVLKVIQFAELDKQTMRFLRQIILGILLHVDVERCTAVFERIPTSSNLQQFREGLRLFISHFLMKNVEVSEALSGKSDLLKSRVELVDKLLVSQANKTIF